MFGYLAKLTHPLLIGTWRVVKPDKIRAGGIWVFGGMIYGAGQEISGGDCGH